MEWYYANNGQQLGPVSQETLLGLYQSGEIKGSDLVWNETMADWVALSAAPGLLTTSPGVTDSPLVSPAPYLEASPYVAPPASAPVFSPSMTSGQMMPPNYLWQSIVCVVICCQPFAIAAIIFASKVKPAFEAGDYAGALDASRKAKTWFIVSLVSGLIFYILMTIFFVFAAMAEVAGTIPQ